MTEKDQGRDFSYGTLAALPVFAGMDAKALAALLHSAEVRSHGQGERLFRQGDRAASLHLVLDGRVGLYRRDGGCEGLVEVVPPGGVFIAAAVLTGQPYLMSAVAMEAARVLYIPVEAVVSYVDSNGFARALLVSLAEHYRTHVQEINSLADALEARLFPEGGEA